MRPLYEIAKEISNDWKKVYFGAAPYLEAMHYIDKPTDSFGSDSAKSVVLYFLSNASSWKGENARRIKKELKQMFSIR